MIKWIVLALAVIGLSMAVYTAATARQELPKPPPAQPPSVNPFERGIAGSGIVETATRDIEIAAPEPGLVTAVFVQVGETVKAGDPLFRLDDRTIQAELLRAQAALDAAQAQVARLEALPRPEDLPPLRAFLAAAEARLADAQNDYALARGAEAGGAASPQETDRLRFAVDSTRAQADEARARLDLLLAGAWEPELQIARAAAAQAAADIDAWTLRKERLTVRSPIDGVALKREIEPGEYTAPGASALPPMTVGDLSRLRVRAQVNEEDAPLLVPGARGVARVRGPIDARFDLAMVRIEPLARPKRQLTGVTGELVDTRVVEAVFDVVPDPARAVTVYPGQLVDVYIDASAAPQIAPMGAMGTTTPGRSHNTAR